MCIDFIQYLSVDPFCEVRSRYKRWTKKRRKDWMHPDHGPLPDEVALFDGEGKPFKVAVWLTDKYIIVCLELFSEDPEKQWSPDLRGNILQTFRWTVNAGEETIECRAYSFRIPDIEDEELWRETVIQMVMKESVRMCLLTRVGESWRAASRSETHHSQNQNDLGQSSSS